MSMRNEVRVGVVVILGVALLVLGTIWMQGWRIGEEEQDVRAWFREIGQLQEGSAVKLRGVPIGRVEEITLDTRSTGVVVRMSISSEVRLPEDPVVLLSPESLFGDWQAEIYPRTRYPFYDYAISPEPGVMPGYSLPDMSRLTAVADRIAENLAVITDRIDIAFTDETAVNIREAIDNIQQVTAELTRLVQAQEQTVQEVAEGLQNTTSTLSEAAATANRAFGQIETAIAGGELSGIMTNLYQVSAQLDTLTAAMVGASGDLESTLTSADSTFESLNNVVSSIEQGDGTLGMLLQDTALYRELVTTNALVQDLLLDFQRNPRKYINLRVF